MQGKLYVEKRKGSLNEEQLRFYGWFREALVSRFPGLPMPELPDYNHAPFLHLLGRYLEQGSLTWRRAWDITAAAIADEFWGQQIVNTRLLYSCWPRLVAKFGRAPVSQTTEERASEQLKIDRLNHEGDERDRAERDRTLERLKNGTLVGHLRGSPDGGAPK